MTLPEQIVYLTAWATSHADGNSPRTACEAARNALGVASAMAGRGEYPELTEALGLLPVAPPAEQARRDNVEDIVLEALQEAAPEWTTTFQMLTVRSIRAAIERKLGRPLRGR